MDSDPFKLGSAASAGNAGAGMSFGGADNSLNEQQARDRLQQLGSRKAISSADFENFDAQSSEMQQRFQSLQSSGATQISSNMMFGIAEQPTTSTQQRLENIKDNAQDFFNNIFSRLQQAGGYGETQ